MICHKGVFAMAILIATVTHKSAYGADFSTRFDGVKPAVSGLNGQITLGYGYTEFNGFAHSNLFYGAASVTVPVGERVGMRFDINTSHDRLAWSFDIPAMPQAAASSNIAETKTVGLGTSLFWRNPNLGEIGISADASHSSGDNPDTLFKGTSKNIQASARVVASVYLDSITLGLDAGGRYSKTTTSFATRFPVGLAINPTFTELYNFVGLNATYYVSKDFGVSGSVTHSFGKEINYTVGTIGATAMLPFGSKNVAVFANGIFARNTTGVNTGIRMYFGQSGKSLIERDRED